VDGDEEGVTKEERKEDKDRERVKVEETKNNVDRTQKTEKKHSTQHILVFFTPLLPGFARLRAVHRTSSPCPDRKASKEQG
jgi:hypothetical protein